MICLKTQLDCGSEQWRTRPVCSCKSCEEYFRQLRIHGLAMMSVKEFNQQFKERTE